MKNILATIVLLVLFSCTETNNSIQRTTDSSALKAIDSSVIMNDSTQLPKDSMKTTVAH